MYTIEKEAFDTFLRQYMEGYYPNQRLGQAFYNKFDLYKMNPVNQKIHRLFEYDGEYAIQQIKAVFNFS